MSTIDISKLSLEQLAELRKGLRAQSKATSGDPKARATVIDSKLQEKDGNVFRNTTAEILEALQDKGIVSKDLSDDQRANEIKKIQTRKQLLWKKDAANKVKYGYKISANGFAVTLERAIKFIKEVATAEDKKALKAALK